MPPKKSKNSSSQKSRRSESDEDGALGADAHRAAEDFSEKESRTPNRKTQRDTSPADRSGSASQVKTPRSAVPVTRETVADHPLLEALCSGAAVATAVDDIVSLYRTDPHVAVAVLITTVCRASGAPGTVTVEADVVADKSSILSTLEEVFARIPADAAPYMLANKDPKLRRFKSAFPEFFEKLIVALVNHDMLSDGTLLDLLANWLSAMGESRARSFRHTASVAQFAVVSGLADRMHAAREALETARKKDAPGLQRKFERLRQQFDDMFTYSVHPRTKDVAPEIRLAAFASLRNWLTKYPEQFLDNRYLRYYQIALNDKRPELRAEALVTFIQVLEKSSEHLDRMRDFLHHFAERLTEMVSDVDSHVADLALKAAGLIIKADHENGAGRDEGLASVILTNDMIDNVLLSIMDDRAGIRLAAGSLLKSFIRCRTALGDKADFELTNTRAEALRDFALTLRGEFGEPLAERYLVDSLWTVQHPPQLLIEYKPYFHLVKTTQEPRGAETMLRLLAALLDRLKGPLSLGPAAKDDVKGDTKAKTTELDAADLRKKISRDLAGCLNDVFERFLQDSSVVEAICEVLTAIDLDVFNEPRLAARLEDCVAALRKATVTATSPTTLSKLTNAWRTLAFTEYSQKASAEAGLQDTLKLVLKQLANLEKGGRRSKGLSQNDADLAEQQAALGAWRRVAALASLVALTDQMGLFQSSLRSHVAAHHPPALLSAVLDTCYCTVLWKVGAAQNDSSVDPNEVAAALEALVGQLLIIIQIDSETSIEALALRVQAQTLLSDLLALPIVTLSQAQQRQVLIGFSDMSDGLNDVLRQLHDRMKEAVKVANSTLNLARRTVILTRARKQTTQWESSAVKLALGISRLFTFHRFDRTFVPEVLLQWTKAVSKQAADIYKGLFHTIRDRESGDKSDAALPFPTLEKNVLLAGLSQLSESGSTPAAFEAYAQLGSKLSSLHFIPNDRHYPDVPAIVRWGVDHATTTNPAVLHAVAPYCARLKQTDALIIANSLTKNDFFSTVTNDSTAGADVFARAFISAIRRAAKLEDLPRGGRGTSSVTPGATAPRSGAKGSSARSVRVQEEDGFLAGALSAGLKDATPGPKTSRALHADGWRVRSGDAPPPAPQGRTPRVSQKKSTQSTQQSAAESAVSTLFNEMESDAFISTQEWT